MWDNTARYLNRASLDNQGKVGTWKNPDELLIADELGGRVLSAIYLEHAMSVKTGEAFGWEHIWAMRYIWG